METQMKTLIAALALGIILAAPAFVQSRGSGAITECMALQNREFARWI
jgi:hypothetical protein